MFWNRPQISLIRRHNDQDKCEEPCSSNLNTHYLGYGSLSRCIMGAGCSLLQEVQSRGYRGQLGHGRRWSLHLNMVQKGLEPTVTEQWWLSKLLWPSSTPDDSSAAAGPPTDRLLLHRYPRPLLSRSPGNQQRKLHWPLGGRGQLRWARCL